MKFLRFCLIAAVASLSVFPPAWAQWTTQVIGLKPGWNAVFLEVDPEPQACDALFAGLPIESVWDFNRSVDSPQFIQDPSTLIPGGPDWLTWFPSTHPLAAQASLFALRDGRAYLIKVAQNAQAVNWTVTGRPSLRRISWRTGGLNFVGFHVGATAPTFQRLFAGEVGLVGQPVYSLDAAGVWRPIPDLLKSSPKAGEAYWVRCQLPAQRTASIQVDAGSQRGLSFTTQSAEQSIRIRNTSAGPRKVTIKVLPSSEPPQGQPSLAGPVPLEHRRTDFATTNLTWEPLSTPLTFSALAAGQEWNIRLGARRAGSLAAPGSQFQSLLEITDDLGTRWLLPVKADPISAASSASGLRLASVQASNAGLWVGEAVLNGVSLPADPGNPSSPRRAGGEFSFRVILHVDEAGTSRLLQQAYIVRKPPTVIPDPEDPDSNTIDQPARQVVVTDEGLIPGVIGSSEIVGRRVSSAAFGFKQPVVLSGTFGAGALTGTVIVEYDDPVNPFRHAYHPDHNNLDERFEEKVPEGRESFTVKRSLSLQFTSTDPLGLNPPGWGDSEFGGTYSEAITGLHRDAVQVSGTFRLVRVSEAPVLNQ